MKRSNRLMLLLGVLLAVVAFGGVLMFGSKSGSNEAAKPQTVSVVTALQDVALGTTLTPEILTTVPLATDLAIDTFRDPAQLAGKVVRRPVTAGIPFTSTDFQSGAVSALDVTSGLEPGQRAMAIPINSLTGVGSLIQAGDYVDVMLTIPDQPDPNQAPVVGGDAVTFDLGTDPLQTSANVLGNDSDPDSGPNALAAIPADGDWTVNGQVAGHYTLDSAGALHLDSGVIADGPLQSLGAGEQASGTIPYSVTDGTDTVQGTITVTAIGGSKAGNVTKLFVPNLAQAPAEPARELGHHIQP